MKYVDFVLLNREKQRKCAESCIYICWIGVVGVLRLQFVPSSKGPALLIFSFEDRKLHEKK